jgi:hypothetical protein
MPFPISRSGTVTIPLGPGAEQTADAVLSRIATALVERGADPPVREGDAWSFRVRPRATFGKPRTRFMGALSEITIWISVDSRSATVRYHLRHKWLVQALMAAGVALFEWHSPARMCGVFLIGWSWLCAPTYLLSNYAFPRFLRATALAGPLPPLSETAVRGRDPGSRALNDQSPSSEPLLHGDVDGRPLASPLKHEEA